jgi:5'-nucleotidase
MKTVLIDMDDTICDYVNARDSKMKDSPGIKYPQSQSGFFLGLKPIHGAVEAVNKIRNSDKYTVYILSRPSYMNHLCYTEKREWIEKYFGLDFCKNLILCWDKSMVKGDYLIDDLLQDGFSGEHIHIGSPRFPNWKSVLKYLDI